MTTYERNNYENGQLQIFPNWYTMYNNMYIHDSYIACHCQPLHFKRPICRTCYFPVLTLPNPHDMKLFLPFLSLNIWWKDLHTHSFLIPQTSDHYWYRYRSCLCLIICFWGTRKWFSEVKQDWKSIQDCEHVDFHIFKENNTMSR
jgi:hypothetical protein